MNRLLVALLLCFCLSFADKNIEISNLNIAKLLAVLNEQSQRIQHLENTVHSQNVNINDLQRSFFLKNKNVLNNVSIENTKSTRTGHLTDGRSALGEEKRLLDGTQPVNPTTAFYAYMSSHLIQPGRSHTLIFDRIVTNENSCYRPEAGIFIAKNRGIYVFTISIRLDCGSQSAYEIVRNAEVVGVVNGEIHNTCIQTHLTGTVVIVLNAGDEVHVRTHSQLIRHGNVVSDVNGWTSFAGWLTSTNVA